MAPSQTQIHQQDNASLRILLDAITDYARLTMTIHPSPPALMKMREAADAFDHLNQRIGRIQQDETNQPQNT